MPLHNIQDSSLLLSAFQPCGFHEMARRTVNLLTKYLAAVEGGTGVVLPTTPAAEMAAKWDQLLQGPANHSVSSAETVADRFEKLIASVLDDSTHLHHPRFVGHQVAPPLPAAALCDLVAALLNNGMAVQEMGPAATALEAAVIRWMSQVLGFGADAGGILTSGGSLGTLTALLAARRVILRGAEPPHEQLSLLASDQAHYCIERAVRVMGWGEGGIARAPTDENYRLRASALELALRKARAAGRRVIAVVASACTTATGSFDPLDEIAEFCARHGLWLHVDGAHGAAAALSPRYRHLVDGIERADSVVWDAHKMMLMPALATAVIYRQGTHSAAPFVQDAPYLFSSLPLEQPIGERDIGPHTFECTKRMIALKLFAAISLYGPQLFAEYVTRAFDLAREFARMIDAAPDFELAIEPEANIVCFRYRPDFSAAMGHASAHSDDHLDGIQHAVRAHVVRSGQFYLVQTRLARHDRPPVEFLRATLMNPLTSAEDLQSLLDAIRGGSAAVTAGAITASLSTRRPIDSKPNLSTGGAGADQEVILPPARWSGYDSTEYLCEFYSGGVTSDEAVALRYQLAVMARRGQYRRALDYGSGPTLLRVIAASGYAQAVDVADVAPSALQCVQQWRDGAAAAHDWSQFTRFIVESEGASDLEHAVAQREALTRRRLDQLVTSDLRLPRPLICRSSAKYDLVVSAYCVECAEEERSRWTQGVAKLVSLLEPHGTLILVTLRGCRTTRLKNVIYPTSSITQDDLHTALSGMPLSPASIDISSLDVPEYRAFGWDGILVASATRRA